MRGGRLETLREASEVGAERACLYLTQRKIKDGRGRDHCLPLCHAEKKKLARRARKETNPSERTHVREML